MAPYHFFFVNFQKIEKKKLYPSQNVNNFEEKHFQIALSIGKLNFYENFWFFLISQC